MLDFTEMAVTLQDLYTTAQYDLDGVQVEESLGDVADVELTVVVADGNRSAIATGIVHPGEQGALGSAVEFNLSGRKFVVSCDEPLSANCVHTFAVNIGKEYAEIEGESTIVPWDSLDSGDLSFLKEVWDGETIATSFSGVAYNPDITTSYEITNGEELAYVAQLTSSGDDLSGITFTMLNNIDLGGHSWTPIGFNETYETKYNFNGTFDGGGYKVKNLYVETDSYQGAGLFGVLEEGGVIKNLAVEGDVSAGGMCAGVVGAVYSGEVTSCSFSGSVTTTWSYSGGIVGYLWDNGVVKGCSNSGTISAIGNNCESIGGIVGYACGSTITECYNVGDVSTEDDNVGGIVGLLAYRNYDNVNGVQGKVTLCYNTADITASGDKAGGIVGFCSDSYVESTYNSGTVKAGYPGYSGGVIGFMWVSYTYTTAECYYSYNIGDAETAGLIGYLGDGECYVNSCVTLADPSYSYYDVGLDIYTDISYANSSSVDKVSNVSTLSESDMKALLLTDYLTNGDWLEDTEGVNGGFPILNGIDYN